MAKKRPHDLCKIEGCGRPYHARGWCARHYLRWYKSGHPIGGRPGRQPGEAVPGLATTRQHFGLTQRELAGMLGVDKHFVYELEKGYKRASKETVSRLVVIVAELSRLERERTERLRLAGVG